ncbi:division plane positioning ATPase MipZ [Candidatus Albibeggiatoa sp. nov. BB20]|uniref:nucleotide-binding protein n=1 Tax=Candidatus Albibeggiatoa sp. nov. BB20 TaxID=3162723 RepID=UPI0033655390
MITVIGNLKGGSGKSTVTFNYALWLLRQGETVVAYDLDPQSTLSDVAQVRAEEKYEPPLKVYTRYVKPKHLNSSQTIIDVGTANMAAMKKVITFADRIVVPVTPSQADVWSTQRFLYLVASEVKDKPPEILAFVNRADTHAAVRESDQVEDVLRSLPGIKVLETRLCQRTVYRRSFSEGLAVFEMESSGKGSKEFDSFARTVYEYQ